MEKRKKNHLRSRYFSISDQNNFAFLSGDFNPIHISELEARRTIFGECIVHGINSLLWGLESFFNHYSYKIIFLEVTFLKPIFLKQEVLCLFDEETKRLELYTGADKCVDIKLNYNNSENVPIEDHNLKKVDSNKAPNKLNQSDIKISQRINISFSGNPQYAKKLYPYLTKILGAGIICQLASLSEIIGMRIPGMNSLYKSASIDFIKFNSTPYFKVINSDERINLISVECHQPSLEAIIQAYFRPQPAQTNSCSEIYSKYKDLNFKHVRAIIIGGSRGLGATVAKLIAVGGGSSLITYKTGKEDAEEVKYDINNWSKECETKKLDILLDDISGLDLSSFNQIYYFASPKIRENRSNIFDHSLYMNYCKYYVNGLSKLAELALKFKINSFFYPSSIFIDEKLLFFKEYIKAKIEGENVCKRIEKTSTIQFLYPRLPAMDTDQNLSILPRKLQDNLNVMKSYIDFN